MQKNCLDHIQFYMYNVCVHSDSAAVRAHFSESVKRICTYVNRYSMYVTKAAVDVSNWYSIQLTE